MAVSSRVSQLISILRLNLVLTCGIPPEFRGGVHLFIKKICRYVPTRNVCKRKYWTSSSLDVPAEVTQEEGRT